MATIIRASTARSTGVHMMKRCSLGLLLSPLSLLLFVIQHVDVLLHFLACLCMSLAGLEIRAQYSSRLLVDCVSILLENSLILHALKYVILSRNLLVVSNGPYYHNIVKASPRQYKTEKHRRRDCLPPCQLYIRVVAAFLLIFFWGAASFGDLMFQQQTHGVIPSLWIIAAGLKNPTIHLQVQVENPFQRKRFIGSSCRVLQGLAMACALLLFQSLMAKSSDKDYCKKSSLILPHKLQRKHHKHANGCVRWRSFFLLIFLYSYFGAWAPVTNLTCAIVGFIILTPPGSRGPRQKTKKGNANFIKRPNVIVVVHESLSGWALETSRGKDATPFYQSLQQRPETYFFRYGRTVAGTTTIATPAILTGLLAYDKEGVSVLEESTGLAADFKVAGYDTGSFVSYGTDWSGTGWAILSNLLRNDFDHIIGPKETNQPRVNEYGMDDRVTIKYFKDWISSTMGISNATDSDSNSDAGDHSAKQGPLGQRVPSKIRRNKPFFATIVFQNQHFPHLQHEKYSGLSVNCSDESVSEGFAYDDAWDNETYQNGMDYESDDNCWDRMMSPTTRYYSSLRTMDESLRYLFDTLNATGDMKDTIIVGAGDHGETPGVQKRLGDIDGPILVPPVWMYIPTRFLPPRAFLNHTNHETPGASFGEGSHANTFLRLNTNRTVSTLDVMPTLKDILEFPELYSDEQKRKCVTGVSLLSRLIPENRIVVGWGGTPIDGINVGTFSSKTNAMFYYPREESKSRIADMRFDDTDPFFTLYEQGLDNVENKEIQMWKKSLEGQGWLEHDLVKARMPILSDFLRGFVT